MCVYVCEYIYNNTHTHTNRVCGSVLYLTADLSPAEDAGRAVDVSAAVRHGSIRPSGTVQTDRAPLILLILQTAL